MVVSTNLILQILSRRFIWYDDNKNGIQDEGDKGVPGVKVTLIPD